MFMELIRNRRSIRSFLDKKIEEEKINLIKEAALRSPSSRSRNPWEFIFIEDKELLSKLSEIKPHGASFVKNSALSVLVMADPNICDVWVEDCSITMIFMQLAAESIGLKSCWVQIRDRFYKDNISAEEKTRELLKIPEHMKLLAILSIGYPALELEGHPDSSLEKAKIHKEIYGG